MTISASNIAIQDDYPTRLPEEQWLERRDPTVWREWSAQAPLTREEMQSFEKNGYLVLKGVFSANEVEVLQAESARMRSGAAELKPETSSPSLTRTKCAPCSG